MATRWTRGTYRCCAMRERFLKSNVEFIYSVHYTINPLYYYMKLLKDGLPTLYNPLNFCLLPRRCLRDISFPLDLFFCPFFLMQFLDLTGRQSFTCSLQRIFVTSSVDRNSILIHTLMQICMFMHR